VEGHCNQRIGRIPTQWPLAGEARSAKINCKKGEKGMKKFVVLLVVALLALALAIPASAGRPGGSGAAKALLYDSPEYTCEGEAGDTSGRTYGFVVMNTNSNGNLIVAVSLKRARPRTVYQIWVNQNPGGCPAAAAAGRLVTNLRGNGNATLRVAKVEGAKHFWVSAVGVTPTAVSAVDGGWVLRSPAVELD
jgi:hypothetical protein